MDQNIKDLLETVIFIKDNMVTKDTHEELVLRVDRMEKKMDGFEKKMDDGFTAVISRMGGIDNRIDNESAGRKDFENRVRAILPDLPLAPEWA
ncbi:hypothetical protein HYT05_01645 [Candidatus Kaiserbacteria bacterium]|nr:hypothetical protein [Candidatus Kaiserbacteria bacterium]